MKISEVLISIIIFSLISVCLLYSLPIFNKAEVNAKSRLNDCVKILETDEKIRNEIREIKIPYWENTEKFCKLHDMEFMNHVVPDGTEILSMDPLIINGKTEGLRVLWIYKNKTLETEERFASRVIY